MKLNLVLLALLPQALCTQRAIDPAKLELDLRSEPLNAWIESIAAKRNISTDAVRANVKAMTYHLDPVSTDAVGKHPGSAGGEDGELERRQQEMAYLEIYGNERRNDRTTNNRLLSYHESCREANPNPPGCPYIPSRGIRSFWRGSGAACRQNKVRLSCKIPNGYGPPGWNQNLHRNVREIILKCPDKHRCIPFEAWNFTFREPVKWAGCVKDEESSRTGVVNNIPAFGGKIPCPMQPESSGEWDLYGVATDGKQVTWTMFTGRAQERLIVSQTPTFLASKLVQWRGKDIDYEPWLKFTRVGEPATITLYSHFM